MNVNDYVIRQDIRLRLNTSCSDEVPTTPYCSVYCPRKDALFSRTFTRGFAAVT
jgi:hypothetical protein